MQGGNMQVMTDMMSPSALTGVNVNNVESMNLSSVSPMPNGLLDTFREDEILDLLAYLASRGNRKHEMFIQEKKASELPKPDSDGFITLFNGKDLTNWEGLEGYW